MSVCEVVVFSLVLFSVGVLSSTPGLSMPLAV